MSPIRPLEHDDLEEASNLYLEVTRPHTERPLPELAAYFERLTMAHPWSDEEIPSLVFEQPGVGIVGFIASYSRRLRLGDRTLRLACSGQLVAHPEYRNRGVGALLMRRYMKGPQDLTITDGATDEVSEMWRKLGGRVRYLASNSWTRLLGPASYARRLAAHRLHRSGKGSLGMLESLDRLGGGWLAPQRVDSRSIDIGANDLVEMQALLAPHFRVLPDYDPDFADWLLTELSATVERGELLCRAVDDAGGRRLGYYVAFHELDGVVQVLHLAAPASQAGPVLDQLVFDAYERGASAVEGRLEAHLYSAARERNFFFRRGEWALVHGNDAELLNSLEREDVLLTRLEGEWWTVAQLLTSARQL